MVSHVNQSSFHMPHQASVTSKGEWWLHNKEAWSLQTLESTLMLAEARNHASNLELLQAPRLQTTLMPHEASLHFESAHLTHTV